jgi:hypothetical protein
MDDRQTVRRVEAVGWLLRCDSQAEPVLRALARDGFQERAALGAAQRQPQLVDNEQAGLVCTLHVVPAHLSPHELLDQMQPNWPQFVAQRGNVEGRKTSIE